MKKRIITIALIISISLISMGAILPVKDGFEYQRIPGADDSWNEVEIMGYFGDEVDLVIPSEIDGMPVTSIGNFVFSYNGFREFSFETVTIPDTVTRIGDAAFLNNYKIKKVIMGDNVEYIGDYAFYTNQITEVNIPNKVTHIGDYAFSHNRLSSVEIPKDITYLGAFAFNDNQLSEIIIPKNISRVENSTFSDNKLTEVVIPDNITSIGNAAFYGNELSSIIIPNSVTSIESIAFSHNKIKTAFIPSSVTAMEYGIFSSNEFDLTIYGDLNSTAHIYAKENGYNFVRRNDNLVTVKFDSLGGTLVEEVITNHGANILEPMAPVKENHIFAGWYKEKALINKWDFNKDIVEGNMTLYAKWIAADESEFSTMKIGDYVQFGRYLGEPILWRVINIESDGSPMLYSEKILCLKPFDAAESGREFEMGDNSYTTDANRQMYGSNNWENSNLREWLNSKDNRVKYTTQPPTKEAVAIGNVYYANEPGFLYNFTPEEIDFIKYKTHKSILADIDKAESDGGVELYENHGYIDYESNYDKAYYKNVNDKIYLLDDKEIMDYIHSRGWEYRKKPTEQAAENAVDITGIRIEQFNPNNYWEYWTRTPDVNTSSFVAGVVDNNYLMAKEAVFNSGVVPTLNLKTSNINSGYGTINYPFIPDTKLNDTSIKEMEAKSQVSLNKSWDISFNFPIDMDTINKENIYIIDKNNNTFPTRVVETEDDSKIKLVPLKEYTPGDVYTIWIKDVKSKDGRVLKQRTKMNFTTMKF